MTSPGPPPIPLWIILEQNARPVRLIEFAASDFVRGAYAPTYIVDYIMRETVGKLVEGKTPRQVGKLRVLDPASGSGSFLIGAYQLLLDWYLDCYLANDPAK